jgi:group I intron endonuclease
VIVYAAQNRLNGKVYVGKTVKPLEKRWSRHLKDARRGVQTHFQNALREHGPEAFILTVLHRANNLLELSAMETFFIVLHQSYLRGNGYNMTMGGDGGTPTAEARLKISAAKMGNQAMKGQHHSSATKAKIGDGNRRRKRRPLTSEAKARIGAGVKRARAAKLSVP